MQITMFLLLKTVMQRNISTDRKAHAENSAFN